MPPALRGSKAAARIDAVLGEAKIVVAIHGMFLLRHVELGEMAAVGRPLSCRSDHDAPILLIANVAGNLGNRSAPGGSMNQRQRVMIG